MAAAVEVGAVADRLAVRTNVGQNKPRHSHNNINRSPHRRANRTTRAPQTVGTIRKSVVDDGGGAASLPAKVLRPQPRLKRSKAQTGAFGGAGYSSRSPIAATCGNSVISRRANVVSGCAIATT